MWRRLSDWRTRPEANRGVRLIGTKRETSEVKSLYFRDELCSQASPGQYVMVWALGVDEVPMSLSTIGETSSVTVRVIGVATEALHALKTGDKIGVRGPFGNGYALSGCNPLLVGGGVGVASLAPMAETMVSEGVNPVFILGARSAGELVFINRLERLLGDSLFLATDDGSLGFKGFASECAESLMKERAFDIVYTCGPELMMISVFNAAEKRGIPIQASLERYIKCAIGLCGSCAIGPYRVCADGPVFSSEQLRNVIDEFGRKRMEPSGQKIAVDH